MQVSWQNIRTNAPEVSSCYWFRLKLHKGCNRTHLKEMVESRAKLHMLERHLERLLHKKVITSLFQVRSQDQIVIYLQLKTILRSGDAQKKNGGNVLTDHRCKSNIVRSVSTSDSMDLKHIFNGKKTWKQFKHIQTSMLIKVWHILMSKPWDITDILTVSTLPHRLFLFCSGKSC